MARDGADQTQIDDLIPVARWLCRHHGVPFAEEALRGGLPEAFSAPRPEATARVLDALGLRCQPARGRPSRLDPAVLPVVLSDAAGRLRLLVGIDPSARRAAVIDPESPGTAQEMDLRALNRAYPGPALLVTPRAEAVLGRLAPEVQAMAPRGHWLWSVVGAHRGVWAQVLLAALGMNLLGLALPLFVMNVYDRVIPNLAFVTLTTLAIGVGLALVLDLVLRALRTQVLEGLARRVDLDVAARLFRHALSLKLLHRPGGASAMISNIRDFETVREFFTSATLVAAIDLAFVGVFLAALFWLVGPLAWVPIVGTGAILSVALLAQRPIARSVDTAQQMAVKRHVVLVESLLGAETIKSLNAEPVMLREWERAVAASARVNARTRVWSAFTGSATQFVQQAVSVGIVVWGVFLVSEGAISIGALIAANILAGRVLAPMAQIAQTLFRTSYALRALRAIDTMMQAPAEAREGLRSDLAVREGRVALREVSFAYPGSPTAALNGVSLEVAPGECVALLGRVGSGKTTLGKLLTGMIAPDSGLVLVDGYAVAQYEPAMLRAGVGYLPQEAELFTGTIRENLLLGRAQASDDELQRAIYLAGMDRFVAQHPDGLNLFVGEKGARLSGGQRQAVALARLLLRRPRVLFLDEPTNALDHQTEQVVIARLAEIRAGGTTLILCTHRMAVAALADRYIVLEAGRKLLDGPKSEVLAALQRGAAPARREG